MKRGIESIRSPELLLTDILQREARGESGRHELLHRATVLAVDLEGGRLQNKSGAGSLTVGGQTFDAIVGVDNPRGAIKARILTNGFDRLTDDSDVRIFWPVLPFDQIGLPVAPGEHVYVLFEGTGYDHGLWLSRVSGHESANVFIGSESYTAPSSQPSAMDSFEPNPPSYRRDDAYASQAPTAGAMSAFGDT